MSDVKSWPHHFPRELNTAVYEHVMLAGPEIVVLFVVAAAPSSPYSTKLR